jgi:hypothetical protein
VLLHPVVQVALDAGAARRPPPRRSGPRGAQLGQPLAQLRGERHVLDRGGRLRDQRGEQLAVAVVVPSGLGPHSIQPDAGSVMMRSAGPAGSPTTASTPGNETRTQLASRPRATVSASRGSSRANSSVCSSSLPHAVSNRYRSTRAPNTRRSAHRSSRRRNGWNATAATTVTSTAASTGICAPKARPGAAVSTT